MGTDPPRLSALGREIHQHSSAAKWSCPWDATAVASAGRVGFECGWEVVRVLRVASGWRTRGGDGDGRGGSSSSPSVVAAEAATPIANNRRKVPIPSLPYASSRVALRICGFRFFCWIDLAVMIDFVGGLVPDMSSLCRIDDSEKYW